MSLDVETKTEGNLAGLLTLPKQLRFAAAKTATALVKEAQREVIAEIQRTFITRNPWFLPTNRLGIHFKPATVQDLTADVSTNAWFLVPHETSALKSASDGEFLAVPTRAVQPDVRQQIPRERRPRNLQEAFILQTRTGPALFQRIGRTLERLYHLKQNVQVPKRSTVIEPTVRVVTNRYLPVFAEQLQQAMRTAKL